MTARPRRGRPPTDQAASPEHLIPCRLPVDLYDWLRLRGFHERRRMQSIALEAVTAYRTGVKACKPSHYVTVAAPRASQELRHPPPHSLSYPRPPLLERDSASPSLL